MARFRWPQLTDRMRDPRFVGEDQASRLRPTGQCHVAADLLIWRPRLRFPTAISDWVGELLTVRERTMMVVMNELMEQPEWERKIFDEAIVTEWKGEALEQDGVNISENMWEHHCTESCGRGEVVPCPDDSEAQVGVVAGRSYMQCLRFGSKNFQRLPREVRFSGADTVKFTSYMNNLHPEEHQDLVTKTPETKPVWLGPPASMGGVEGNPKTDDEGHDVDATDAAGDGDEADSALHLEVAGAVVEPIYVTG
ncbi:hypothetical protein LTR28_004263 [Elasticomyces elasticus]|nr:hypothetical protein LTR28_004263 [Elasticomyces elasticus]